MKKLKLIPGNLVTEDLYIDHIPEAVTVTMADNGWIVSLNFEDVEFNHVFDRSSHSEMVEFLLRNLGFRLELPEV
jgi:glycine cleavage system H lipoate-binding protein